MHENRQPYPARPPSAGSSASPGLDVIVVGAGPAGCRAAFVLGSRGKRVLLLDGQRFPRWKPCAGGVTAKAARFIPPRLRAEFQRTMRGAYLTFGDRHVTHVTTGSTLGWMVHRESFDAAHLALVRALPSVDVEEGNPAEEIDERRDAVEVRTKSGVRTARLVIGADGVNSIVSRSVPGHESRSAGFAYEGEATVVAPALTEDVLFDFRKFPRGYGWVFPKRDHYSVGGYVMARGMRGAGKLYDEFCGETAALARSETYRRRGYRVPHGGGLRRPNTARLLLAGDAADLVDPLTGEGIYYALRSGDLAARAAADFLDRGASLDRYGRWIREEIQEELRIARVLASIMYRRRRTALLLLKNRVVCRWCIELLSGRMTYRDLRHGLVRHALQLPLAFRFGARQRVELDLPA